MSRGDYSLGKRQRETQKARKKQEKAARRTQKRSSGSDEAQVVSLEDIVGKLPSVGEAMQAIENRAAEPRGPAPIPCRLFVGGISYDTTGDQLNAAFAEFGVVSEAAVVKDRDTGQSRGFGFVTMANRKDAGRAIDALNGSELNGRRLMVNVATDRQR
jgi:RNA recognition motif-containing protein